MLFLLTALFSFAGLPDLSEVVVVKDQKATQAFCPNSQVVAQMMEKGLCEVTHSATLSESILSLVSTNDVVGIKVYALKNGVGGTRIEVVKALVQALKSAGLPQEQIVIWDRSWESLYSGGFMKLGRDLGVPVLSAAEGGFDETVAYSSFFPSSLVAGDVEFGKKNQWRDWQRKGQDLLSSQSETNLARPENVGRRSFVTKLLTQKITKLILVTPLIHHNSLGAAGNIYSLASGCTDNFLRFENDGYRLAEAASEIYAMEAVGDKVVLCITDALLCQYRGQTSGFFHYSLEINELRFSKDPVALDVGAFLEMMEIRQDAAPDDSAFKEISLAGKTLCENAVLLELGNAVASKIQVRRFALDGDAATPSSSQQEPAKESDGKRSWWKFWKW